MAITVKQFCYYGAGQSENQPAGITLANMASGSIFFRNVEGSIKMLGVQATPGTKFYINNSPNPIIIGSVGNYQLDLQGISEITALSFDESSLNMINDSVINGAHTEHIIVDAIYEVEES